MKEFDFLPGFSNIGGALKAGLPWNAVKRDARMFKSVYDTGYTSNPRDPDAKLRSQTAKAQEKEAAALDNEAHFKQVARRVLRRKTI